MKVLVTGAAGQVGCRLVRQLLDQNDEVRGTILAGDPARSRLDGLDIELREGDLTDFDYVVNAVKGVDAVIHTANLVGPHFELNNQINLQVTRACEVFADRLERYVYTSSSGVFPNNGENIPCAYHPVDEWHPKRPDSEYSMSKYFGEIMAERAARETGLRHSIVRPSHVLSETKILNQFSVARVVNTLKKSQSRPGTELHMPDGTELWHDIEAQALSPNQPCSITDEDGRPWLYQPQDARDIAHCLVCALKSASALGESFNAGAPEPFPFPEGARLIAEKRGVDPLAVKVPLRYMYDHAIDKAKRLIAYSPQGDLKTMIESAFACEAGETDYTWD